MTAAEFSSLQSMFIDLKAEILDLKNDLSAFKGQVAEEFKAVRMDISSLKIGLSDLTEEVRTHFRAYDKDAEKILDHEKRIRRIEKASTKSLKTS